MNLFLFVFNGKVRISMWGTILYLNHSFRENTSEIHLFVYSLKGEFKVALKWNTWSQMRIELEGTWKGKIDIYDSCVGKSESGEAILPRHLKLMKIIGAPEQLGLGILRPQ